MNPTLQQEAVFEAVAGDAHVCVEAVAGAGKTSTSLQAANLARGSVGFVAFNKSIAAKLQTRLGGSATACTLHSLGYAACRKAWNSDVDQDKSRRILAEIRPFWFRAGRNGKPFPLDDAKSCLALASLAKATLSQPGDYEALVDHYGLTIDGHEESCFVSAAELIERCEQETDTVDFDDMVWLPVRKMVSAGNFDTLFVDESQDLNRVQQMLASSAARRLVIIGDAKQAIYGFSGSDCHAMQTYRNHLSMNGAGLVERPLTVTFRCPQSHVVLAQKIVPQIQAAENAVDGAVYDIDPHELSRYAQPGDMVVSRVNAPLLSLVYRMILAGVPAVVRGRDVGRGLLDLIDRLRPADLDDLARKKLPGYLALEQNRLERQKGSEQQLRAVEDRVSCLEVLCSQVESLDKLREFISSIFSDDGASDQGKVVLSSVHRAKGLEAARVFVLAEKLPLVRRDSKPWMIEQEYNLAYIAVTRATRELFFVGGVPSIFSNVSLSNPLF